MRGVVFGTDVILTGLLGTPEGLAEMVMIETSLTGMGETGAFSNIISWLSIRRWIPVFNRGQSNDEDKQIWQSLTQPGNIPAFNKFNLMIGSGVKSSSTVATNKSSSIALVLWPFLGIGAEMSFGFSSASNSISFASIRS